MRNGEHLAPCTKGNIDEGDADGKTGGERRMARSCDPQSAQPLSWLFLGARNSESRHPYSKQRAERSAIERAEDQEALVAFRTKRIAVVAMAIVMLALGAFAAESPARKIDITQLADHIYKLSYDAGGFTNKVIASVGADGILLVDAGEADAANDIKAALATLAEGAPKYIIETHEHGEHIGGTAAWGDSPVTVGHRNLRTRLTTSRYLFDELPPAVFPEVVFSDSLSIFFNGEEIKLIALPGAHSSNDIVVWFTGSKVVCTGALSNGFSFPSVDKEGGDLLKYPAVVERLIDMLPDDVKIVPGHGADCSMADFRAFHTMLINTIDLVKAGLAQGKDLAALQADSVLRGYESYAHSYVSVNQWIRFIVQATEPPETRKTIYAPIYFALRDSGVAFAVQQYYDLKENHGKEYRIDEPSVVAIGYKLYVKHRYPEAIAFLELAAREYPQGGYLEDVHVLLCEMYQAQGERDKAVTNCRRTLEINPENADAIRMLTELQKP